MGKNTKNVFENNKKKKTNQIFSKFLPQSVALIDGLEIIRSGWQRMTKFGVKMWKKLRKELGSWKRIEKRMTKFKRRLKWRQKERKI